MTLKLAYNQSLGYKNILKHKRVEHPSVSQHKVRTLQETMVTPW